MLVLRFFVAVIAGMTFLTWNLPNTSATFEMSDSVEAPSIGSSKDIVSIVQHSVNPFIKRNSTDPWLKKRFILDDFISRSEASLIETVLIENESMLSDRIGSLRFMPLYPVMMGRFLDKVNQTFPDRVRVLCKLLRVVIKMWDFTEDYFQVPMLIETANANMRRAPPEFKSMVSNLPNGSISNFNTWSHGLHADTCTIQANETHVYCVNLQPDNSNQIVSHRQYSAILYLNSIAGGDFSFIDLPPEFDHRKLFSLEPPSAEQLRSVHRRLQNANSPGQRKESSSPSSTDARVSELLNHRIGMYTIVPPSPGRMMAFTSGPENIHGVTELWEDRRRHALSLWLTRADSAQHAHRRKRKLLDAIKLYH